MLDTLFGRPMRLIYAWARNRRYGPLRTLAGVAYRFFVFFRYSWTAWRIVRSMRADIYHCHDLNTLPLGYMAKWRYGGRLVYDAHELTTELAYVSYLRRVAWGVVERFLIRRADEVVTTGSYRAEYLVNRYGIGAPTVILNCPPLRTGERRNQALREKLDLADDRVPLILYQGGFMKGRGLDRLVQAAASLHRGVLVLMGRGDLEAELRKMVKEKGLEQRIYFAEPVSPDEVVQYCMSASVGVVIYLRTGLNNYCATPNKLYEYIQAGVPMVSSNFPALKEVVEGYGLGCTFDPEEPESIAAAINLVLGDERRYDTMKKNARKAARIFNWENEARKLLEIYRRLSYLIDDRTT